MPDIIAQLGEAFEAFKETNEIQIKELRRGLTDCVTEDKLTKINKVLDDLTDAKSSLDKRQEELNKRQEELEIKFNRPNFGGEQASDIKNEVEDFMTHRDALSRTKGSFRGDRISNEDYALYKSSFGSLLRSGVLPEALRTKTMSVGIETDGGYVVPPAISNRIVTRVLETSNIRQYASVVTISTDALEGMRDTDEASSGGWVDENDTRSVTNTPTFGKWRIPVFEQFAQPKVTQQLLDDAAVNIESWLATKVADKLTRTENTAFVTGTGVGQPQGFCSYTTAATADGSRSWGTFEHVVTGVNGAFPASSPADIFFDLEGKFKPAYLNNAQIFTRRAVVQAIRKFKSNDSQYLWQPGLIAGKPATIIGYPVVLCEDMPAYTTTGALGLALGNMAEAYTIVDRAGFRLIRDNLTDKPYVKFHTSRRVGAGAVQFEALKFLKFST